MPSFNIAGLILAGGRSSRMGGQDKAFVELAGQPMIGHVIERISRQCAVLAVNSNAAPEQFAPYGLPVLADQTADYSGPLAGVLAGLDWAAEQGHSHILSVAVDTPFFPESLVEELTAAAGPSGLSLAASEGPDGRWRHPTFGLWPVALRENLRQALAEGMRKVVLWTDKHDAGTAVFSADQRDPFFNINTPEDLRLADEILAQP